MALRLWSLGQSPEKEFAIWPSLCLDPIPIIIGSTSIVFAGDGAEVSDSIHDQEW
jgi:hypothetical protein